MDKFQENDASALCVDVSRVTTLPNDQRKSDLKDENHADPGGWTPLLVLGGATCCLGSALPAGFNIGVLNNPAHLIQNFCNASIKERYDVEISKDMLNIIWSSVVSIFLIGGVSGSIMASWLADRYGRKGALAVGNICGIVGAILFLLVRTTNSVELLLLGRIIVGLSGGLATSLLPMYMTEIAPLKLRGAVGVLCQLGLTCGVLLAQVAGLDTVLGTKESWHIMLGSVSPLCVLALLLTFALPESPKYLYVIKEQPGRALKELSRIRNMDIMLLQKEEASLRSEAALMTSSDVWSIKRVFKDPSVRLPLLIVCFLQGGQQLSGINAVFYYSSMIFASAGLDVTGAQYATLGTGFANIGMAIVSVPVMSVFSRRKVFLCSCYLTVACLIVLCVSIKLIDAASFMPWLCISSVLAYVVFYGIGLGPIPYFIGSEIFEVGPRPAAMAMGSVSNWGGNFLVGMLFPSLQSIIGPFVFLIFAGFTLLLALFTRIYMPETRGRNTADIAATITRGFSSRPNKSREF